MQPAGLFQCLETAPAAQVVRRNDLDIFDVVDPLERGLHLLQQLYFSGFRGLETSPQERLEVGTKAMPTRSGSSRRGVVSGSMTGR